MDVESCNEPVILHEADPSKRETLDELVAVDTLAHEQSIITDEVCI